MVRVAYLRYTRFSGENKFKMITGPGLNKERKCLVYFSSELKKQLPEMLTWAETPLNQN